MGFNRFEFLAKIVYRFNKNDMGFNRFEFLAKIVYRFNKNSKIKEKIFKYLY